MFEKWTRKVASRATDSAVEGMKTTLNDRIDQYGDIIKIGLVLSVIIFGGKHLTKREAPRYSAPPPSYPNYPPQQFRLPQGNGTPIVINNFYGMDRKNKERMMHYGYQQKKQGPNYQKRENRR